MDIKDALKIITKGFLLTSKLSMTLTRLLKLRSQNLDFFGKKI